MIEVLEDGEQHILHGHSEDISTLGIKNDGLVVATGGCVEATRNIAQICIWDLTTKSCDMVWFVFISIFSYVEQDSFENWFMIFFFYSSFTLQILEKHHSSIVSLQYSRDDRFLVSVSDYRDCSFIVWCAKDYYILCERKTIYPVHTIRWNPFTVNELCSVGRTEGVMFWALVENKPNYAMEVLFFL